MTEEICLPKTPKISKQRGTISGGLVIASELIALVISLCDFIHEFTAVDKSNGNRMDIQRRSEKDILDEHMK